MDYDNDDLDALEAVLNAHIVVGDVVQVRSGGPWMTVQMVMDGMATCLWFTVKQEPMLIDVPCLGLLKSR
jgi:hypothetical protein